MKTLTCKDLDSTSACEFKATGATNEEVMASMTAHVATDHADKVDMVTDEMMIPHIKEEAAM